MSRPPTPSRRMTPQQDRTAATMYVDGMLSIYSIGQRLGIPPETIRKSLARSGVALRFGAAAQRVNRCVTPPQSLGFDT